MNDNHLNERLTNNTSGDDSLLYHYTSLNSACKILETKTLKLSNDKYAKYANKINGQDVLLIDDTISRGQTIKEACDIIQDSYAPKSITVLTLLSKLN